MKLSLSVTKKQRAFIDATEEEVLFGGAAGGGKSYGQMVDALLFALSYPGSKQLILRRTFAELDKSLIRTAQALYPREIFSLNSSSHTGKFKNGSTIDFGYCATESDVYQYQSAEYDVIRFDELTHFTEGQYIYLISRVRGANGFPKQVKSSTNPGGVGHSWVKARFVDPSPPRLPFTGGDGMRRIFIPSLLDDNTFLSVGDPEYRKRLEALPEREKKALLYGDWNIFEGQYFSEFRRELHVISPFEIPSSWRKYRTLDYGLDRLAVLWIAVAPDRRAYVYREYCESSLPISAAARAICDRTPKGEDIYATLAPPDLWSRTQETGKTKASIFSEFGVNFTKTSNDRECGWLAVKELLCTNDGRPGVQIFNTCTELISCLPALSIDKQRPTDCSTEPHELTHAPDALRGFAIFHTRPADSRSSQKRAAWSSDMWEDYNTASDEGKQYLKQKYGEPM
jgi:hypothetical protein